MSVFFYFYPSFTFCDGFTIANSKMVLQQICVSTVVTNLSDHVGLFHNFLNQIGATVSHQFENITKNE